ncbi:DNA ligase [Kitasatospora sp. NPDC092948]|uniref:ATP-dependent DNA ligase n=1 Tax=Kitasatospora sp. NPDC092948 TaxID=3364088 RepID=UPI0038168BB1
MPRTRTPVALRPPVEVMQPVPVRAVPAEDALPGGVQYTIKVDGIRAVAHIEEEHRVRLISRRGNDLTDRFPQLPPALATLPIGTVLDGEIVAYTPSPGGGPGHLDFHALLRTDRARRAAGVQVHYVAWDALAVPGRDVRGEPLRERWTMLEILLAAALPPLALCMATTDRAVAMAWYRDLAALGVEGIVAKGLDAAYRPGTGTGAWQKTRHIHTTDAELLGVAGSARRPEALFVALPDGRRATTSPRLTPAQARELAEHLAGRLRPAAGGAGSGAVWEVDGLPRLVEVVAGTGRHATVRYVRLRPAE